MSARTGPARSVCARATLGGRFLQLGGRLWGRAMLRRPVRWDGRSRAELYEEAQRLAIRGRSRMTKAELGAAVRAARIAWWRRAVVAVLLAYPAVAYQRLRSLLASRPGLASALRASGGSVFGSDGQRHRLPGSGLSRVGVKARRLRLRERARTDALVEALRAGRVVSSSRAFGVALLAYLASAYRALTARLAAGLRLDGGLPHPRGRFGRETPRRWVRQRWFRRRRLLPEARAFWPRCRSRMQTAELAQALRAARVASWSRTVVVVLLSSLVRAYRGLGSLRAGGALAFLPRPKPIRVLVLSGAAVAAGASGLMAAYAVSPKEDLAAQVLVTNGSTMRIVTVAGPEGTTTVAVTKTKEGKTRLVPVRLLETVTGAGETETVSVAVLGPPVTATDEQLLTQMQTLTNEVTNIRLLTETSIVKQTETEVVTETQPVTVVVTEVVTDHLVETEVETETLVATETVVDTDTVTVTETIEPPPP
jgi:hypothetical protein